VNTSEKDIMIGRYENRFAEFGRSVKSLGWGNEESQNLRFQVLSEIGDLLNKSVLDVGCGFGDLYGFLSEKVGQTEYLGVDVVESFILEGRGLYPKASFEMMDITEHLPEERFDYVISSGTMNLKLEDNLGHIKNLLKRMLSLAKIGVAVNFLSSYVDYELEKDFHFPPGQALELGKSLTRFVTIRHDYPLYEYTMYLYHEQKS